MFTCTHPLTGATKKRYSVLVTSPASGHNAIPDISQYVLNKSVPFFSPPHTHLFLLNQKLQISPTFLYLYLYGPGSVTLCLCI